MTFDNLMTLGMLILLQAVLGFDNLLYISLESKRAPADKQALVRRVGIGIAIVLRIALLFILTSVIQAFTEPWFTIHSGLVAGEFNLHSVIVLLGGVFILYTAVKEIYHMLGLEEIGHGDERQRSIGGVIFWIVLMNLVFSFDSILSAMALSDVFWVMAAAIVAGGVLMIWLADTVSAFLQKNRMYEVLGLFVLLIVGVMLLSEGGHLAHLHLLGHEVTPMSKTTFYFVISVLVLVDVVQSRYQKRLLAARQAAADGVTST
jgi:predicted tellurium resistance membrane protein TerC